MEELNNDIDSKPIWFNFIWQPLAAIVFLWLILYCLDQLAVSTVLWAIGAGSLASSCYILFGRPSSAAAAPKNIIGGYLIGMLIGGVLRLITLYSFPSMSGSMGGFTTELMGIMGLLAAIAVGVSMLLMMILGFEHPPAAGMTLVLVLDVRDIYVIIIVIASALVLSLLRILLRHHLRDLYWKT